MSKPRIVIWSSAWVVSGCLAWWGPYAQATDALSTNSKNRLDCGAFTVSANDPGPKTIVSLKRDRIIRVCNRSNKTVVDVNIDGQMFSLSDHDNCVDVEGLKFEAQFNAASTGANKATGLYCLPRH